MLNALGKIITHLLGYKVKTKVIKNGFLLIINIGIRQKADISFMEIGENTDHHTIVLLKNPAEAITVALIEEKTLIKHLIH